MKMAVELKEMENAGSSEKKKRETSLVKKLMFQELEKEFAASEMTFFSRFNRLSVQDMSELRRNLEKMSRRTVMVKHSFAKKILEKGKFAEAARFLEGSILVTLGAQEPQLVSKTLVEFVKGHENFELKGMIFDGKVYEGSLIKELAKLPSRKELLTQVAIRMKSPIAGFVMVLGSLIRSLAIALNEIHKKRIQESPQA